MSNPVTHANTPGPGSGDTPPIIDGYSVQAKLGQGGMSTLWKAQQNSLGRDVVIKVLSSNLSRGVEDIKQFMFEAQVAASLKHQGIVQVYDFGQCKNDSRYYFVMEYISGYSVGEWIRRKGHISAPDALIVAQSVAEALRYAWNKSRIVHCDIKPDNIMVDGDGTIKLTDLGLAHAVGNIRSVTNQDGETLVMGTPNYMAPEQVRGDPSIDCRTDVYALGASLYHMVTGHLPFMEADGVAAMELQINYYVQDPRKINPSVGAGISCLIEKMMMKKPERRHKDWTEVIEDIYLVQMGTMPVGEPPEPGESTVSVNRTRERPAAAAGLRLAQTPGAAPKPANMKVKVLTATDGSMFRREGAPVPKPANPAAAPAQRPAGQSAPDDNAARPRVAPEKPVPKWKRHLAAIRHVISNFFAIIRMLLSIALIIYISYVSYMKFARNIDVLEPVRETLSEYLKPAKNIWNRLFPSQPRRRPDRQEMEFYTPPDDDGAETQEYDDRQEPEPAITEEAAVEPPEMSVPDSIPPPAQDAAAGVSGKPAADDIENTAEFKLILGYCEKQKPKPAESITLILKDKAEPVTGIIDSFTSSGIKLIVENGLVDYPFSVMNAKTRMRFFPLANARNMYRKKYLTVPPAPSQD